ncbi:MAG: hypothetical protein J0H83_18630 [Candidatus Melainabacteria bacterium]|nr:hypothetical protein [Candidatus Melainabacteria bacterium]
MASLIHRVIGPRNPPSDFKDSDSYFEKLLKAVPADIVATYITIQGILAEHNKQPLWLSWAVFVVLLVLIPPYVCYVKTEPTGFVANKAFHRLTSCIAFFVWVFAMGGPFATTFDWHRPYFGSIALIVTRLFFLCWRLWFITSSNGLVMWAREGNLFGRSSPRDWYLSLGEVFCDALM